MALFTKSIMNVQPVGECTVGNMVGDCIQHFGVTLFITEKERLEHESDFSGLVSSLKNMFGKTISLNTDCIMYEETINFLEGERGQMVVDSIADHYMKEELNKHVESREQEYSNFIKKVLKSNNICCMEVKVFRIGQMDYYGYTLA